MSPEEWRTIPGWEGIYEASTEGRIRSWHARVPPRILRPYPMRSGHLSVSLNREGQRQQFTVHRLVMLAFVGDRPEGMDIRHLDGNPGNNRPENLKYGSRRENNLDAVAHGRHRQALRTHCPSGHPYNAENSYVIPSRPRARYCRACQMVRRSRAVA